MNIEALEYGIVRYGTPLYVFDLDELQDNVQRFRSGLKSQAGLCFAMKANPFLVRPMSALVDRIEVCSMGEYRICRALQIPPEKILVSGVMKKKEDLLQILEDCRGRCCYTVESLTQFGCLASWCDAHEEEIRVYLRLTSGNQFGMDKEALQNIMELKAMYPFLKSRVFTIFPAPRRKMSTRSGRNWPSSTSSVGSWRKRWHFPWRSWSMGRAFPSPILPGRRIHWREILTPLPMP